MGFLNGLRKAHLLRRKTLDATNSRITQPLMEETQRTSITMQPTEQNAIDCCFMEISTDVTDDGDEMQQFANANTTSNNTIATTATTTTTLIPTYEKMLKHTTTALVTITTVSSINSTATVTAATAAVPSTATSSSSSIINPLGTLPAIQETSISTSSTCNKINILNQSPTTTAVSIEPGCLAAKATFNSNPTFTTNNNLTTLEQKLVDEAL